MTSRILPLPSSVPVVDELVLPDEEQPLSARPATASPATAASAIRDLIRDSPLRRIRTYEHPRPVRRGAVAEDSKQSGKRTATVCHKLPSCAEMCSCNLSAER